MVEVREALINAPGVELIDDADPKSQVMLSLTFLLHILMLL
jgi:hypothetical protein